MVNDGYWMSGIILCIKLRIFYFNVLFHVLQNIPKCIMKDSLLIHDMAPFADVYSPFLSNRDLYKI